MRFNTQAAKDLVEIGGKVFLGLLAACYGLGLVVVNIHLNQFGVFSVGLFRVNYITAGLWELAFIILPALIAFAIFALFILMIPSVRLSLERYFQLAENARPKQPKRGLQIIIVITFVMLTTNFLLMLYARIEHAGGIGYRQLIICLVTGGLTCSYAMLISYVVFMQSTRALRAVTVFLSLIILSLLMSCHTWDFATKVYGRLPSFIGGGQPKDVQLIVDVDPDTRQLLTTLGVKFEGNTSLTTNLKMLMATESEYIFLIESAGPSSTYTKSFSLRHDAVRAIQYESIHPRSNFNW